MRLEESVFLTINVHLSHIHSVPGVAWSLHADQVSGLLLHHDHQVTNSRVIGVCVACLHCSSWHRLLAHMW